MKVCAPLAGFFLAVACSLNPQPEPPSAEFGDAAGSGARGGVGGLGGAGGIAPAAGAAGIDNTAGAEGGLHMPPSDAAAGGTSSNEAGPMQDAAADGIPTLDAARDHAPDAIDAGSNDAEDASDASDPDAAGDAPDGRPLDASAG